MIAIAALGLLGQPVRADDDIIPAPTAIPQRIPLSAEWQGDILHITIANPSPTRCLELVGGNRPTTHLPESCGVTTYDLPAAGVDSNYAPAGRVLRLVDTGQTVYELPIPVRSVIYLPFVAKE